MRDRGLVHRLDRCGGLTELVKPGLPCWLGGSVRLDRLDGLTVLATRFDRAGLAGGQGGRLDRLGRLTELAGRNRPGCQLTGAVLPAAGRAGLAMLFDRPRQVVRLVLHRCWSWIGPGGGSSGWSRSRAG